MNWRSRYRFLASNRGAPNSFAFVDTFASFFPHARRVSSLVEEFRNSQIFEKVILFSGSVCLYKKRCGQCVIETGN